MFSVRAINEEIRPEIELLKERLQQLESSGPRPMTNVPNQPNIITIGSTAPRQQESV